MTASHGVGTYGNAVGTVTPTDHKLGQAGLIAKASSSLAIRPGVFWGGADNLVTGTSGMTYNVAAFTAVLTRGASSGAIPLANDGVFNVATTAAPGSNSRYDVVYVWQREFSIDGTDSNPVIGVLQGTVAASPTIPALTSFPGAIALANILIPAGVTATNTGTTITQSGPFTATAGGVVMFRNGTERDANVLPQGSLSCLISTGVYYQSNGTVWSVLGGGLSKVAPSSVVATGGTAALSGSRSTFTTVNAVNLVGLFPTSGPAYDYFEVEFYVSATSGSPFLTALLGNSGTPVTTANYDSNYNFRSTTTNTPANTAAGANWTITAGGAAGTKRVRIRIENPNLAVPTTATITASEYTAAAVPSSFSGELGHRLSTAYADLQFVASTGTMTGFVDVFGYSNS